MAKIAIIAECEPDNTATYPESELAAWLTRIGNEYKLNNVCVWELDEFCQDVEENLHLGIRRFLNYVFSL